MRHLLFIALVFMPVSAAADGCDDLWFTRNLIMDRAGYCFGSALGRAVFDNSDCIGKAVTLPPGAAEKVAEIRALESQHQCRVDTGATTLDVQDIDIRRKLHVLPIRDEFESACIGWRQGITPLRASPDAGSPVIGRLRDGDTMLYSHLSVEGWSYVTVYAPNSGPLVSGGWLGAKTSEKSCKSWAG